MLQRIDRSQLRRRWREPGPQPVDVINLIEMVAPRWYLLYGACVVPTIYLVGGGIMWTGRHAHVIHGECQAGELLVVRYPSIARFLAMTVNPYYALINRFREMGVKRFEASFCRMERADRIAGHPWTVALHWNGDEAHDSEVRAIACEAGGNVYYRCREYCPFDFLTEYRPTDPQPMRFKALQLIAFPDRETAARAFSEAVLTRLRPLVDDLSIQLYREFDWRTGRARS
jgi:uncharacterized protein (DUF1330 family)